MTYTAAQLPPGTTVIITHGNRKDELAKVQYVRLAPPQYSLVEVVIVLCLDGRSSVYPIEHIQLHQKE